MTRSGATIPRIAKAFCSRRRVKSTRCRSWSISMLGAKHSSAGSFVRRAAHSRIDCPNPAKRTTRMCEDSPRQSLWGSSYRCQRIGAVIVGPGGAPEKAALDQVPDAADDRNKDNQHPPAGLVAIVKAFDPD